MLKIIKKPELSPKAEVHRRIRTMRRPDGMLQCGRCGGRVVMTATAGVVIKNGRKTGGTVIEKDVCAICYKQDVFSPMMPKLERIK